MKNPAVYMLASKKNGTLYIGVTSDLVKRIWQHKNHIVSGFTEQHQVNRLVYFGQLDDMESAIMREKALKKWQRAWKIRLIEKTNPDWLDLYDEIIQLEIGYPTKYLGYDGKYVGVMRQLEKYSQTHVTTRNDEFMLKPLIVIPALSWRESMHLYS